MNTTFKTIDKKTLRQIIGGGIGTSPVIVTPVYPIQLKKHVVSIAAGVLTSP